MVTIGNISSQIFKSGRAETMDRLANAGRIIAQAQSSRGMPGTPVRRPQAAARVPAMSCREAETILARMKAGSERSNQEHRADMRRRTVDDSFERTPPVDEFTHDVASVYVQLQLQAYQNREQFDGQPSIDSATRLRFLRGGS